MKNINNIALTSAPEYFLCANKDDQCLPINPVYATYCEPRKILNDDCRCMRCPTGYVNPGNTKCYAVGLNNLYV
jgi:hypothetical protein